MNKLSRHTDVGVLCLIKHNRFRLFTLYIAAVTCICGQFTRFFKKRAVASCGHWMALIRFRINATLKTLGVGQGFKNKIPEHTCACFWQRSRRWLYYPVVLGVYISRITSFLNVTILIKGSSTAQKTASLASKSCLSDGTWRQRMS